MSISSDLRRSSTWSLPRLHWRKAAFLALGLGREKSIEAGADMTYVGQASEWLFWILL